MQREYLNKLTEFEEALGALLRILFIRAERVYEQAHSSMEPERSSALMREFRLALEENFRTTQSVGDYAKLLKISSDRLGKAVQERSGRPAGEIIRQTMPALRDIICCSIPPAPGLRPIRIGLITSKKASPSATPSLPTNT